MIIAIRLVFDLALPCDVVYKAEPIRIHGRKREVLLRIDSPITGKNNASTVKCRFLAGGS